MRKLKIVLNEAAIRDLEEIWLYTFHKSSIEQADRYHTLIMNEIEFLSKKPKSGKNIDHLRVGYWSAKVKSHIIFYRLYETEIEVIRILHESMDIPNRLED
jgi:toxin ParE1/3/4